MRARRLPVVPSATHPTYVHVVLGVLEAEVVVELVDDVGEVDVAATELEGTDDEELVPEERRYSDIRLDPPQMSEADAKGVS